MALTKHDKVQLLWYLHGRARIPWYCSNDSIQNKLAHVRRTVNVPRSWHKSNTGELRPEATTNAQIKQMTNYSSGLTSSLPNEQLYSLVSHQNSVLSASAAMMLCSGLSHTSSRCAQITAGSHCDSHPRSRSRSRRSSGSSSALPGAGNQASRPADEEDTEARLLAIVTCPVLFVCVCWWRGLVRRGSSWIIRKNRNTPQILQALTVSHAQCLLRPWVTSAGCSTYTLMPRIEFNIYLIWFIYSMLFNISL